MRSAAHGAVDIANRRDGDGNVDRVAVFVTAYGLEVVYPVASPDAFQNRILLVLAIFRQQHGHVTEPRLFRRIAVQPFRPGVPCENDAVETLAYDGVLRGTDDGRQLRRSGLEPRTLRHVAGDVRGSDNYAGG